MPSEFEPATIRFVPQYLNHYATAYFGSIVNQSKTTEEIKERLIAGNNALYAIIVKEIQIKTIGH
jgi:hypothetical protein